MNPARTHYEVLEVLETASADAIKGAYKFLAHKWHPDRNADDPETALRRMTELNEAMRVLSDSVLRARYDAQLKASRGAASSPSAEGAKPGPAKRAPRPPAARTAAPSPPQGLGRVKQRATVALVVIVGILMAFGSLTRRHRAPRIEATAEEWKPAEEMGRPRDAEGAQTPSRLDYYDQRSASGAPLPPPQPGPGASSEPPATEPVSGVAMSESITAAPADELYAVFDSGAAAYYGTVPELDPHSSAYSPALRDISRSSYGALRRAGVDERTALAHVVTDIGAWKAEFDSFLGARTLEPGVSIPAELDPGSTRYRADLSAVARFLYLEERCRSHSGIKAHVFSNTMRTMSFWIGEAHPKPCDGCTMESVSRSIGSYRTFHPDAYAAYK